MISSITISDSRSSMIGDAIRSVVDQVDRVLLVDTGIHDDTIERAREIAGDKLRVIKHEWVHDLRNDGGNFSAARNAALDFAKAEGVDWAIMVDTDERFDWRGVDLRRELATFSMTDLLLVQSADGTYRKEKLFRPSSSVRFIGPTHETPPGGTRTVLQGAVFHELAKTPEQLYAKFVRDVGLLEPWIKHSDQFRDGRWHYYLGASYAGLQRFEQAAAAFGASAGLHGVGNEDGAFAAYHQAECFRMLGRVKEAIETCLFGMSRRPLAELAWLTASSCYRLGYRMQAVQWAQRAIQLGRFRGASPERTGFVNLSALYELPYDVLRNLAPTEKERKQANLDFHAAKCARLDAVSGAQSLAPKRPKARIQVLSTPLA